MGLMRYKTKITLYNSYFDMNDRLTAKSILNIFQDVASIHGEKIGVGFEEMLAKNLYWVLSRIKFDILKMPKINQTVIVETWPHEKGRVDFDRDIKITNEEGETLIIGTSKWCVIDSISRTLQRTDGIVYDGEYCDEINYEGRFNKIVIPQEIATPKFMHTVRFSDLDHNHHMNNTNYANLVVNAINDKVYSHFEINYLNECKEGNIIDVSAIQIQDGTVVIGAVNGERVFVSLIK